MLRSLLGIFRILVPLKKRYWTRELYFEWRMEFMRCNRNKFWFHLIQATFLFQESRISFLHFDFCNILYPINVFYKNPWHREAGTGDNTIVPLVVFKHHGYTFPIENFFSCSVTCGSPFQTEAILQVSVSSSSAFAIQLRSSFPSIKTVRHRFISYANHSIRKFRAIVLYNRWLSFPASSTLAMNIHFFLQIGIHLCKVYNHFEKEVLWYVLLTPLTSSSFTWLMISSCFSTT